MREILQLCGLISEKGKRIKKHMKIGNNSVIVDWGFNIE